jgi:hypothetical protein
MRTAAALASLVVALALGIPSARASGAPPALQPADQKVIDRYLSNLANQLGGQIPQEVPQTIRTGDLNHDGTPDVSVLFTIEGPGNGYAQYLAVFLRTNGKLTPLDHATVGGKFYRAAKLISIQDGLINLDTTGYAPHDPTCCPTIKGTTQYQLVANKLKEIAHP